MMELKSIALYVAAASAWSGAMFLLGRSRSEPEPFPPPAADEVEVEVRGRRKLRSLFLDPKSVEPRYGAPLAPPPASAAGTGEPRRWDATDLPIARAASLGFRPVHVYSAVPPPDDADEFHSQAKQDALISAMAEVLMAKNLMPADRPPFFVDLAANDALTLSNTYKLERLGWDGVCVEPNPTYWYRLAAYRTCAVVGAFVGVSEAENGKEVDVALSAGEYGGIVATHNRLRKKEEKRNLVAISTIFEQTNVPRVIDYLSLDIEGAELMVMQSFPFDEYVVRFMTVERPQEDLRDLLASRGYKLMRVLVKWGETFWMHESIQLSAEEVDEVCNRLQIGADPVLPDCKNGARGQGFTCW